MSTLPFFDLWRHRWVYSCSFRVKVFAKLKARHVFIQLKPRIRVPSKSKISSEFVGKAIMHLLLSLWTQPLNELAELHFLRLNLENCRKLLDLCSNISAKIMVSWKLYSLFSCLRLSKSSSWQNFLTYSFSLSLIIESLSLE